MSVYKVIQCDSCARTEPLGPSTFDWGILAIGAQGMIVTFMTGTISAPVDMRKENICPACQKRNYETIFSPVWAERKKAESERVVA